MSGRHLRLHGSHVRSVHTPGRDWSQGLAALATSDTALAQALQVLPVPEQYRWSPTQQGPGSNLAQAYVRFARDFREGTNVCPTFDDAVTRHRMLRAIEIAAATGQRQTLG